ncbi:SPFH domain-containing protein [Streptomyces sp. NPDC086554]|uniref:SPFH domain-containing protein n=1 Tax=Streptomyces sp. NPDC086554 TaxID=3154864 RepID=UPI003447278A
MDQTQVLPVITPGRDTRTASAGSRAADRTASLRAPRMPHLCERERRAVSGWAGAVMAVSATVGGLVLLSIAGVRVPGLGAFALVRPDAAPAPVFWLGAAVCALIAAFALSGLTWGRDDTAAALSWRHGYRGTVRRAGFLWVPPLLRRHPVDVRLRHWRSDDIRAVDGRGIALSAVVLVVWRVRDTARAVFGVENHEAYLVAVVEAAVCRILPSLPCDAFGESGPSLRDGESLADRLTAAVAAECRAVGIDVYSVQPSHLDYAPDIARAMRRQQLFALDAQLREAVVDNVVDTVSDTVDRLIERDLVSLDEEQRSALVSDLTVAFYAARGSAPLLAMEPPRVLGDGEPS